MNSNPIFSLNIQNYDQIVEIAFSPTGTVVGVLFLDGSVKLFEFDETKNYSEIFTTQPTSKLATCISFASQEIGIVFIVGDDSGRIHLYQRLKQNEFTLIVTMSHHKSPINAVAFAPKGPTFAAASSDGFISITTCVDKCWNTQLLKLSDTPATSVSWGPFRYMSFIDQPNNDESFSLVASSADGFFAIYSLVGIKWEAVSTPVQAHRGTVNAVAWRPLAGFSRTEIATCGDDLYVKLWTFDQGKWSSINIAQMAENPVSLKWSSNGFMLSIGCGTNSVSVYREIGQGKWSKFDSA